MRDFRKIIAWQKSHAFAVSVHKTLAAIGRGIPSHAREQIERASTSIASNIAEGSGKRTDREFARFLDIAMGSAKEMQNRLLFARDAEWMSAPAYDQHHAQLEEVCKVLFCFACTVRGEPRHGGSPE